VVASRLIAGGSSSYLLIGLLFVVAGLAFKIAAVPFHVYAPDVYEGAASPITGMLGFVPKLAGFVALIKLFGAMNWDLPSALNWLVWIMAAATMTVGNVLALLQTNVKRMLAYSSIAHTGYMLIALLAGPVAGAGPMKDGAAALLFYMAVYGVMNLGAFALLSAYRVNDEPAETLDDISGLASRAPMLALAFVVCVFSLMGFPPTAGFLGKLYVFSSALSLPDGHPFHGPMVALVIIGVLNSAIAAAYYLRIAAAVYMGSPIGEGRRSPGVAARWGLAVCSLAMIVLFVVPSTLTQPAGDVRATASAMTAPRSRLVIAAPDEAPSDPAASSPILRRP
jgi:NADH-quinone oxidoreductase subunit N